MERLPCIVAARWIRVHDFQAKRDMSYVAQSVIQYKVSCRITRKQPIFTSTSRPTFAMAYTVGRDIIGLRAGAKSQFIANGTTEVTNLTRLSTLINAVDMTSRATSDSLYRKMQLNIAEKATNRLRSAWRRVTRLQFDGRLSSDFKLSV